MRIIVLLLGPIMGIDIVTIVAIISVIVNIIFGVLTYRKKTESELDRKKKLKESMGLMYRVGNCDYFYTYPSVDNLLKIYLYKDDKVIEEVGIQELDYVGGKHLQTLVDLGYLNMEKESFNVMKENFIFKMIMPINDEDFLEKKSRHKFIVTNRLREYANRDIIHFL